MASRLPLIVAALAGSVLVLLPLSSDAGQVDRETVLVPLIELSQDRSTPIGGPTAMRFDASGRMRWGSGVSAEVAGGAPYKLRGWKTDLVFEQSVDLDQVPIPIVSNNSEALALKGPQIFSALGLIPILGIDSSRQIEREDLEKIEKIGVDFFGQLIFVYGPKVPTAVLITPQNGGPIRVSDTDRTGMNLPLSSIEEHAIGFRRVYVVSPKPELFTSKRPAVAKVPLMIWSDDGERVVGGGWDGPLVNEFSVAHHQLIVSSNVGYLDDYNARIDAIDCGSKHFQVSLIDPRTREPTVLQIQARFSYHSKGLDLDQMSLNLIPAWRFKGALLFCQEVHARDPQESVRIGRGKWNESRSEWKYTGTKDGYYRASWEASVRYWRNLSEGLASHMTGLMSIGEELLLALEDPSIAGEVQIQISSVPRELGAVSHNSVAKLIELTMCQ